MIPTRVRPPMRPALRRPAVPLALLLATLLAPGLAAAAPPALRLMEAAGPLADHELPPQALAGSGLEGRLAPGALAAGRLQLGLADGREVLAERQHESRGRLGERSWVGQVAGAPGSLLALTEHRGELHGFLQQGAEIWEFASRPGGRLRLHRIDDQRLPPEGRLVTIGADLAGPAAAPGTVPAASADGPVVQDLLLLYTAAAAQARGGAASLETQILNAVAAANLGYLNSQVGVRLNVVGLAATGYVETGDMGTSLSRLQAAGDGHLDEAHDLRDQTGADLVALVTQETSSCGIAYVMSAPGPGFAPYAFSVTQPACFSNQTLAHEIGHNQGNAHDASNGSGGAAPYAHGYRTCDHPTLANGQDFRTVMAYPCGSSPRINHFSNPQVLIGGVAPTGIAYTGSNAGVAADNARSMNETAALTAAFRSPPPGSLPAVPGPLSGSAPAFDRIELQWADLSDNESGFVVQRAVAGGSFIDRASLPAGSIRYTDTGLSGGTLYSYRVRAYNSLGSSAHGNTLSLTTPAAPAAPAAPAPASLTLSGSTATLVWTNVAGESGYEIRRETLNLKKGSWAATVFGSPAEVTTLSQSLATGTYRYAVRALGAGGSSAWVTVVCSGCGADGSFTVTAPKGGGRPR